MTPSRPFATVTIVVLAIMLIAGCTRSSRQNPAPMSSGSSTEKLPRAASTAPRLEPGTASGSVTTTGTVNDTWRWHQGDAVDCAPPSIVLRSDRSSQSVAGLTVASGAQDKAGVRLAGETVPGGGMSGDSREKAKLATRDWLVDAGNVRVSSAGIGDAGHIVIDHVALASLDNSAKVVINGEFWFRCK